MTKFEIVLIAISLATDAFAVSLSKGFTLKKLNIKAMLIVGLYFGTFQAGMPLIGYHVAKNIGVYLIRFSHIISFIILFLIGLNMFFERDEEENALFDFKTMIPLAIGTSIDALAVGVTFSLVLDNILKTSLFIGIITFMLSCVGVFLGNKIKNKINIPAKKAGGLVLIILGIKMLLEQII